MPAINPTAAGAGPSQQAPFGSSPVTGPTPNKGFEAAAGQRMGLIVKQLQDMLQMVGAGSEIGKTVLKMLNMGVKLVPSGSVTPAAERSNLERMQMQNTQNNQQLAALKQSQAGQGGGGQQAQPQQQAA